MTLGTQIAEYRKKRNLTQEALAQKLGVTNQAVSKWESDQCCPDVALLPKLADTFEISLDALFGRAAAQEPPKSNPLPWEDDGVLRAVLYVGTTLVAGHPAREKIQFCYEGPALNIQSECSVTCDAVEGNVNAGESVTCDAVEGSVNAGGNVYCDDVGGDIRAQGSVTCDAVDGDVQAGENVTCDEICGDVRASGNVYCEDVEGSVTAGGNVMCDHIH